MRARERTGLEPAQMGPPAHLSAEQPGMLQDLDVLRGGLQGDRERRRKLANRPLALRELAQHPPPRGVAERVEDGIEPGRLQFNHVVDYSAQSGIVNRSVDDRQSTEG